MEDKNNNYYIANLEGRYVYDLVNGEYVVNKDYSIKDRKMNKVYSCSLPESLETIILEENYKKITKQCIFGNYMTSIVNLTFEKALKEKVETTWNKNYTVKHVKIYKKHGTNYNYNVIDITIKKGKKDKAKTETIFMFDQKKCKEVKQITKDQLNSIYKKINTVRSQEQIRTELYKTGIYIEGKHFVAYKRSSSKSRGGSILFIRETMFKKMINISRMGMKFKKGEPIDLASLKSYESLILSGIEGTIEIDPESILLISDINKEFPTKASVTRLIDGKLETKIDKKFMDKSSLFDGQGLVCSSLFTGEHEGKSMILLRNHFYKMAGFSTNLQLFFEDNSEYIVDGKIPDMFNNMIDVDKIKIITTPSAIKLFKFQHKFNNNAAETYKHWKDNCYKLFGVVKHESESKFDDYNQLSYQMLNAMPLKKAEVQIIMEAEIKYIDLLKNDVAVMRRHISFNNTSNSRDMIYNLLAVNDEIVGSQVYKNFKREVLKQYISGIRRGKIKIPNTDYRVVLGNPYEMLLHSIGRYQDNTEPLHQKREVWCPAYKDGTLLSGFRNPLICAGNIVALKNVGKGEFSRYFNLTDNIIVVDATSDDLQTRNNSMDYDSDSMLISNHYILHEKAVICEKDFPTPMPDIHPDNNDYHYNEDDMAKVDYLISNNLIGKIVNLSCELNAIYWNEYWKHNKDEKLLKLIYKHISKLSAMSMLEIDKAKRLINVQMEDELTMTRNLKYKGKEIFEKDFETFSTKLDDKQRKEVSALKDTRKKIKNSNLESLQKEEALDINNVLIEEITTESRKVKCRPLFMKFTTKSKDYKFISLNCPMDWVEEIIEDLPDADDVPSVSIEDLFDTYNINLRNSNRHQIKVIEELIAGICSIQISTNDSEEQKNSKNIHLFTIKKVVVKRLKKMVISRSTILTILKRMYNKESEYIKLKRYGITLLSSLYEAHPMLMLNAFMQSKKNIGVLVEHKTGWHVKFFGKRFSLIRKTV